MALQERQQAGLQGREERDFSELVKGLLNANILDPKEVFHLLVQPSLAFSSRKDLHRVELPLEILKVRMLTLIFCTYFILCFQAVRVVCCVSFKI